MIRICKSTNGTSRLAHQRHNLFLALRPDAETAASIGRLRHEHGFSGRAIREDCLHISLASLGKHDDLPHELIERAKSALSTVAMRPFVVALNRVVGWKRAAGARPLVLVGDDGVIGVDLLIAQIHKALAEAGLKPRRFRETVPHLTLAYDAFAMTDEIVAPVRWTVREFVLVDSLVGEGRHVVLHRWPLVATDARLEATTMQGA